MLGAAKTKILPPTDSSCEHDLLPLSKPGKLDLGGVGRAVLAVIQDERRHRESLDKYKLLKRKSDDRFEGAVMMLFLPVKQKVRQMRPAADRQPRSREVRCGPCQGWSGVGSFKFLSQSPPANCHHLFGSGIRSTTPLSVVDDRIKVGMITRFKYKVHTSCPSFTSIFQPEYLRKATRGRKSLPVTLCCLTASTRHPSPWHILGSRSLAQCAFSPSSPATHSLPTS